MKKRERRAGHDRRLSPQDAHRREEILHGAAPKAVTVFDVPLETIKASVALHASQRLRAAGYSTIDPLAVLALVEDEVQHRPTDTSAENQVRLVDSVYRRFREQGAVAT